MGKLLLAITIITSAANLAWAEPQDGTDEIKLCSMQLDTAPARGFTLPAFSLEEQLAENYREEPILVGLISDKMLLKVYANQEIGSWTLVLENTQGNSLMVLSGMDFHVETEFKKDLKASGVVYKKDTNIPVQAFAMEVDKDTAEWHIIIYSDKGKCQIGEGTNLELNKAPRGELA